MNKSEKESIKSLEDLRNKGEILGGRSGVKICCGEDSIIVKGVRFIGCHKTQVQEFLEKVFIAKGSEEGAEILKRWPAVTFEKGGSIIQTEDIEVV